MAITVDWSSYPYLITIPQSDCTLVSGTRYTITVDHLWSLLRGFSDNAEGRDRIVTYRRIPATASTPPITEINDPTYEAQFEDGAWSVDIIDGNTNFRDVEVKNQVSVGTNNTTGFINPTFLELGLFGGKVSYDADNGFAGTDKTPSGLIIGTRQAPVNNPADALTIATTRGLSTINFLANTTLSSGDFSAGYQFEADSLAKTLSIGSAPNVMNCNVTNLTLDGEMDGINNIKRAIVNAITGMSGTIWDSSLESSISINGAIQVSDCYSGIAATGYPSITTIGTNEVIVRNMRGSMGLSGMTGGEHSVGVYGGRLVIEADCSGGTIYVRGDPYEITDLSGGAVTIINQTDSLKVTELWKERGLDPDDPVTYTGDGVASRTVTVGGFSVTHTQTSATRE